MKLKHLFNKCLVIIIFLLLALITFLFIIFFRYGINNFDSNQGNSKTSFSIGGNSSNGLREESTTKDSKEQAAMTGSNVPFEIIDTSSLIGFWQHEDEKTYVIRSFTELNKLTSTMGDDTMFNELNMIFSKIDFKKKTLIGIFVGTRPAGEYELRPIRVTKQADNIEVYIEELVPGPNCIQTTVLTYPNTLLLIPKTDNRIETTITRSEKNCK